MPSFCEYRNCHNLASSTYFGYCTQQHLDRGMKDEPDKVLTSGLFEMFELRETKKIEPKPKPKEPAKLQVRPLVKPSDK